MITEFLIIPHHQPPYQDSFPSMRPIPPIALNNCLQMHSHLSTQQVSAFRTVFEKYCSTKTLKKPPRSRLNANGVRQIIPIEPEVDITLSEQELGALFQEAGLPLHKQTLTYICSEAAGRRGVSFEGLLRLLQQDKPQKDNEKDDKEWEALFRVYDRRGRGYFDFQDYRFVCEGITLELSQAQMRDAFEKLAQGRAVVRLADFGKAMRGYSYTK